MEKRPIEQNDPRIIRQVERMGILDEQPKSESRSIPVRRTEDDMDTSEIIDATETDATETNTMEIEDGSLDRQDDNVNYC